MEQPVTSWIDMFERVVKMLHTGDKSILFTIAESNDTSPLATWVRKDPTLLRAASEIDEGLYVEKNTSTEMKIAFLLKLFKLYGANPDDLIFYLRDEDTKEESSNGEAPRHILRKKYWEFALPKIQVAHQGKVFSKVHATTDHWLNGYFGISGFCITCVALYNAAFANITLGKVSREENKSAFDYLFNHKLEIETALGLEITWDRCADAKQSYVRLKLENVSIKNETDWPQMAKFHAEWSKKLVDTIVPYLQDWQKTLK